MSVPPITAELLERSLRAAAAAMMPNSNANKVQLAAAKLAWSWTLLVPSEEHANVLQGWAHGASWTTLGRALAIAPRDAERIQAEAIAAIVAALSA